LSSSMRTLTEIGAGQIGYLDLSEFVTADEEVPVAEVLRRMRHCGGVTALLMREGRLSGIFTERDMLTKVLADPEAGERPVRELMTANPVTALPQQDIRGALRVMRKGGFRDLPVVDENGRLLGNLTQGAVVRYLAGNLPQEVLNLPPVPDQAMPTPEGA
jgi:CBS domain-containing protein